MSTVNAYEGTKSAVKMEGDRLIVTLKTMAESLGSLPIPDFVEVKRSTSDGTMSQTTVYASSRLIEPEPSPESGDKFLYRRRLEQALTILDVSLALKDESSRESVLRVLAAHLEGALTEPDSTAISTASGTPSPPT